MKQSKNRGAGRRSARTAPLKVASAVPRNVEKIVYEAFRFVMDMVVATIILWCFLGLEALTVLFTDWMATFIHDRVFELSMQIAHYSLLGVGELLYIVLLVASFIRSIKEIRP